MPIYFDLDRRFVHRTKYEPHEIAVSEVTGKRLKWPQVLENRFVVVVAPANHGKTTEMLEQVIEAIEKAANTGKIGDGKIFVCELEQVIRIRTGETGAEAL